MVKAEQRARPTLRQTQYSEGTKSKRTRWAGHIAKMPDNNHAKLMFESNSRARWFQVPTKTENGAMCLRTQYCKIVD